MKVETAKDLKSWLENKGDAKLDARGASLNLIAGSGLDFSGADFSGASLTRWNIPKAKFSGADLAGAGLDESNFLRADFSCANLRGSSSAWTDFSGADFSGADLSEARFRNCIFQDCDFSGANFSEGLFPACDFSRTQLTDEQLLLAEAAGGRFDSGQWKRLEPLKKFKALAEAAAKERSEIEAEMPAGTKPVRSGSI